MKKDQQRKFFLPGSSKLPLLGFVLCVLAVSPAAASVGAGSVPAESAPAAVSADGSAAAAGPAHDKDSCVPVPTVVSFRFAAGSDAFYYKGNSEALDSLLRLLDPACLRAGAVRVDGYSRTRKLSNVRCSRVKSELIVRCGLREEHFTTRTLAGTIDGRRDVVVVTVPPQGVPAQEPDEPANEPETAAQEPAAATPQAGPEEPAQSAQPAQPVQPETAAGPVPAEPAPDASVPAVTAADWGGTLSLRANLLRWATLTPDLGLEWRVSPSWAILVNGSWTVWSWNDKNRRYALWEVAPEVRYYIGKQKRGYVGAMYKVGHFNYKFSATGRQGDLMGGGLTGGYVLRLNRSLNLDFSVGLGYLRADCDKYTVIDGVCVRQGKETRNWWGPTSVGVTLVWNLF